MLGFQFDNLKIENMKKILILNEEDPNTKFLFQMKILITNEEDPYSKWRTLYSKLRSLFQMKKILIPNGENPYFK